MALLEEDEQAADEQAFSFDFLAQSGQAECQHSNESNRTDIMKKYLVYMELPKIKIGDYRKSSCVSGNLIRFHFLLRIAKDEANTVLRLLPIKAYKAPVVNFAVIHRPFLDDDDAKGPIPKSPGVRSPLIQYDSQDDAGAAASAPDTATAEDIAEDFRRDKPQKELQQMSDDPGQQQQRRPSQDLQQDQPQPQRRPSQEPQPQPQRRPSQEAQQDQPQPKRRPSQDLQQDQLPPPPPPPPPPPQPVQRRPSQDSQQDEPRQLEVESPSRQDMMPPPPVSPARLLSDDNSTAQTDAAKPRQRRPKKYFVYCEIPKVLIGDYRNSSVICSEIIHAHFLMKIAKDEQSGQPQLQPIRRYHRPKVNFAVIHRSLIVDDEAIGPIPRSPLKKSPMIRDDSDDDDSDGPPRPKDNILHATMGFCYGRLPRSKYELVSQWSMVPTDSGLFYPELILSKAEA